MKLIKILPSPLICYECNGWQYRAFVVMAQPLFYTLCIAIFASCSVDVYAFVQIKIVSTLWLDTDCYVVFVNVLKTAQQTGKI